MHIQLPERFSVKWMLNHIRTSSYGVPYSFVDQHILRRPLWLAGTPAVAEFDLSQAGTMELRLLSRHGHATRPNRMNAALLDNLATQSSILVGSRR